MGRGRRRGAARQHVPVPALGVCGDSAAGAPTLHPATPAKNVKMCAWHVSLAPPARCPPLSCVCRWQGGGWAGVLPDNMCPLQPWVCGWVGSPVRAPELATHEPMFLPWFVPAMRPWSQAHAVRKSTMCRDCGARAGQGCYLPAWPQYSLGCVGWDCAAGTLTSNAPTHAPAKVCVWHVPLGPTRTPSATPLCV